MIPDTYARLHVENALILLLQSLLNGQFYVFFGMQYLN